MAVSPFDANTMKTRCQCEDCGLYRARQHPFITGRMADHSTDLSKVKYIVVGEAPGKHEDEKGYCFAGFSGENLEKAFGEEFQYVYLTNICRCVPWDEKNKGKVRQPTTQEMQSCSSWINNEISLFPSNIPIILCGNTAFSFFFPEGKGITVEAGIPRTKNIKSSSRVFIPNFHPAAIGYNPKYSQQFYDIFTQVRSGVSFEYKADPNTKILHPSDGVNYLTKVINLYEKKAINYCVYDSETTSLSPNAGSMIMLGFCDPYTKKGITIPTCIQNNVHPEWKGATVPIDMQISENDIDKLQLKTREFFAKVPIVGHNLKFDIQFASFHQYMNINRVSVYNDTLAMMSVLVGREWEGDSLSLKESAHRVCGVDLWEGEIDQYLGLFRLVVDKHFGSIPTCILYKYCGRDVYYNMLLHDELEKRIPEQKCSMVINNINRCTEIFSRSELLGIQVDKSIHELMKGRSDEALSKLDREIKKDPKIKAIMKTRYELEVEANSKKFYKNGTPMKSWKDPAVLKQKLLDGEYFSVTSPIDKKEFLKVYNIVPILKTDKGDTSVTREALELIAETYSDNKNVVRFCELLQQYSKFAKLKTTYIDGLYELVWKDNRFHPNFNICGTTTGRLCLIEGTKIATLDSEDRTIDSYQIGETFKVYSYDLEKKRCVITNAIALGHTRTETTAIKVTLDNGEQVICTLDHPWLMRNGVYKKAEDLEIGDSLMPLYRRISNGDLKGYKEFYNGQEWEFEHQVIANKYLFALKERANHRIKRLKKKDRCLVVHHKDRNKLNNLPENLCWLGENEHWLYHGKTAQWRDAHTENARQMSSDRLNDRWQDEEFKDKMFEVLKENNRKNWDNPEYRNTMAEARKKNWENSDYREKMRMCCKSDHLQNPEIRQMALEKASKVNREKAVKKVRNLIDVVIQNQLPYHSRKELINSLNILKNKGIIEWKRSYADSIKEHIYNEALIYNHKVTNIEILTFDTPQRFYDIEVPNYHNFAISAGVFTHNSSFFHTMPRQSSVKRLFISRWADKGGLFSGSDMSQLELRVTAAIANETNWIQAYIDDKDLHQLTAASMFKIPFEEVSKEQRTIGKTQNFSILYGSSAESQAKKLNVTVEEANKLLEAYKTTIPQVVKLIERQHEFARTHGYILNMFNRHMPVPDALSNKRGIRGHGERQSFNYLIQSSASDLVVSGLVSMMKEIKERKMKTELIGAVHDSVEFDIYPGEAIQFYNMIKYHFETYLAETFGKWVKCPMRIDLDMGTSWGSCVEMESPQLTEDSISFEGSGFKNDVLKLAEQARKAYNFDYEVIKVKELSDKDFTIVDLVKDTEKWDITATISIKK